MINVERGGNLCIYCDSCDSRYHLTCQDPPLQDVPENNDWKCNKCMEQKEATETEDTSNGEEVEEAARLSKDKEMIRMMMSMLLRAQPQTKTKKRTIISKIMSRRRMN